MLQTSGCLCQELCPEFTWELLACLCLLRERVALPLRSEMRVKLVDSRIT